LLEVDDPAVDDFVSAGSETITASELVALGATDSIFFSRQFFPQTARQEPATFHPEMWRLLDGLDRYVNMLVFRGGAKTTILRLFAAKRIAYLLSKTILIVGKSQTHAAQYLYWLRRHIEPRDTPAGKVRSLYAQTFDLSPGKKWDDEKIQIRHGVENELVWVAAYGIGGSIRGLNFDDWRPDLIIIDDIVDEENAFSAEQRLKTKNLVFGALLPGLAPASESPFAKMVINQTPQDFEDISQLALRDKSFKTARYSCWTPETEDLPLEHRKSSWPARWKDEELRELAQAFAARNEISIFAREYECRLLTPENSTFRAEWISYFGDGEDTPEPPLHEMWTEMVIDPVPPPSEKQLAHGLHNKDYEALAVVGKYKGGIYVLETSANRGHDPSWTVAEFFRLALAWRIRKVRVEATGYQRTLSWLLAQAMKTRGLYFPIQPFDDKQKKFHIISTGIKGPLSHKQLFVRRSQEMLIHQLHHYPNVKHDDEIEAVARGCISLQGGLGLDEGFAGVDDEESIEELDYQRGCP
jgi:phage terminase large subunit-like protein